MREVSVPGHTTMEFAYMPPHQHKCDLPKAYMNTYAANTVLRCRQCGQLWVLDDGGEHGAGWTELRWWHRKAYKGLRGTQ